ncbi:MAG: hypothetical protein OQK73_12475 [Gammaproteobacteria bacterium]|nr:hypothetical protein [Gammaproteobacteria bacterium]
MNSNKHTLPDWEAQYNSFIEAGTAKATRRTYTRDVKYFWDWVQQHLQLLQHYPATVEMVLPFCLYHLNPDSPHPLKVSTVELYSNLTLYLHLILDRISLAKLLKL